MRQFDVALHDSVAPETLSPEQFIERWRPLLESLDRMFADTERQPPLSEQR